MALNRSESQRISLKPILKLVLINLILLKFRNVYKFLFVLRKFILSWLKKNNKNLVTKFLTKV